MSDPGPVAPASTRAAATSPSAAARHESASRRRLLVLVLTGLLLVAQGAYSFTTRPEPYPTVRMPGFGSAPTEEGLFRKRALEPTVGYTDGSTVSPSVSELMRGLRGNSARPTLERAVWPGGDGPRPVDEPEVRVWLAQRAREMGDGRRPAWLDVARCEVDIDIRTGATTQVACDTERIQL